MDIPWGKIMEVALPSIIEGGGAMLTGRSSRKDNSQARSEQREHDIAMENMRNAAAMERLLAKQAGSGADTGARMKIAREQMLQEAFNNIINAHLQARTGETAAMNNIVAAGQNALRR